MWLYFVIRLTVLVGIEVCCFLTTILSVIIPDSYKRYIKKYLAVFKKSSFVDCKTDYEIS